MLSINLFARPSKDTGRQEKIWSATLGVGAGYNKICEEANTVDVDIFYRMGI